jgi:hypothetical protein
MLLLLVWQDGAQGEFFSSGCWPFGTLKPAAKCPVLKMGDRTKVRAFCNDADSSGVEAAIGS